MSEHQDVLLAVLARYAVFFDQSNSYLILYKVRCDERPGSCMNCIRRGLLCTGYTSGPLSRSMRTQLRSQRQDPNLTEAGLERKRLRESCKPCQSGKTKCSGGKQRV